jgi:hypothetical protein
VENLSEEIKDLVCKLTDIKFCSIVCNEKNEIEEIHILSGIKRNVKQLVRDIQSAINARFNINVDYKKISIAQINESDLKDIRLKLHSVSDKNIDNSVEATVILEYEDKLFEGKVSRVKTRNNKFKAIAEATLLAVESYLGIGQVFYIEDIRVVAISSGELCTCVVGYAFSGKEELLSGCSLLSADENEAAAKAVLSAVNRKVSIIG